ncbi:MAG: hypothetical protein JST54_15615 [Deltaproteobacteria bacterium]|nr:hypothetical protein [Deltaproteobacteria bacterium]
MNASRALVIGLCLACSGCSCGTASISRGHGTFDAGFYPDGGSAFTGTLVVTPASASVDVMVGQALPSQQYTATANGQTAAPSWTVAPTALGSIDATGKFTASGAAGGVGTITATLGTGTGTASITVHLHSTQNGADDGGTSGSGVGGVGGVGGEGEGPPVDAATVAVLQSTPTADPGQALLYPYDSTVWPQDLLAPLLQWQNGAHLPDAVLIHLECPTFTWDGTFGATANPFIHHPVPQAAWRAMSTACADQTVQVKLVFASAGAAYGPLTQSWKMSRGTLKGVVYYNSYGTALAQNYSGALPNGGPFGGATLAVYGGSTDPVLIAGKSGSSADCRVCHVVSADGSTLLSEHGDDYSATSSYALKSGNAETSLSPADGRYAWGGVYPDGTLLFSNSAPLIAASTAPSALYQVPSGTAVATTGIPSGLGAGTPVFSPDGAHVAFNWYAGEVSGVGSADQSSLAMMTFTLPGTFSAFTKLYTPASGQKAIYPSFLPTGGGVVFENEVQSNGRGFGETRSTCDDSGACSDTGARGELWWVSLDNGQAARLDNLNGKGFAPTGASGHDDDSTLNYEPTVSPIASGGYAWVIFTSRRLYGNVATINPYWSDPRFHDISTTPTTKKLWVAAVDMGAAGGADISHPAFYLPAQELLAGNSRGYWSLAPCKQDGEGCKGGDECCGGYCRQTGGELGPVCGSTVTGCANEYEKCSQDSDCCGASSGVTCVNGKCTTVFR